MTDEQKIWQFLKEAGFTNAGAAGMMGNLFAESGLISTNLQQTYEKSLGYSDTSYTNAVDSGRYKNFVNDSAGYGLAQWTFSTRKQNLLKFAEEEGASIGDLDMQLKFLVKELQELKEFAGVYATLKSTNSVRTASDKVLLEFESPKNKGPAVQQKRANYSQKYYDKYASGKNLPTDNKQEEQIQVNIKEITSTHNTTYNPGRNLSYIVIHYTAGTHSRDGAAAAVASYFAGSAPASADYIVDDATIVQYNPDIKNRNTWHCGGGRQSSNGGSLYQICKNSNSIGIEVCSTSSNASASANSEAWSFTDAVVEQTVRLTKYLMQTYNIPIDNVIRHYDVTGKWCPGIKGWNDANGNNEEKWKAFKNKVANVSSTTDTTTPVPEDPIIQPYAARVTVSGGLNSYKNPAEEENSVIITYQKNAILAISKEKDVSGVKWGYTGSGWIKIEGNISKVSVTEAIINALLRGYSDLKYDPLTGRIIYPLESWNDATDGGFKFSATDDLLNQLVEIKKQQDEQKQQSSLDTEEFIKNLVIALEDEDSLDGVEYCQEKIQLVLKSAVEAKRTLVESPSILMKTEPDAFTHVSEEQILEKLNRENNQGQKNINEYLQKSYNTQGWNKNIQDAPETLNFWFDFVNTDSEMGQYAVKAIGNRPKAINDDKVTAIYFQETPSVLFLAPSEHEDFLNNPNKFMDMSGYTFVKLQPFMENYFTISGQGKSAKDELDSLLYKHTYATDTTTLTSVPIYHLQPNTRVFVKDDNTGINGEYIVNKITIPLQYNGTSSITAVRAVERIY